MTYVNQTYIGHVHQELRYSGNRSNGTSNHTEPASCKCFSTKPPKQDVLDRIADQVLEYGYVLPYTRAKRKPPSLSRWT